MKKQILLSFCVLCCAFLSANAQFHTLDIPQSSPSVKETQRLGITDIGIVYHSPAVKGRKVWETVVPKNGDPIPWRAGANLNTTIYFSTDVRINGKALKAGEYGFHAIPSEDPTTGEWTLLFAHASQQWGSYYLNREKDVSLEVTSTPEENEFSEQLNYTFEHRTDSTLQVAIEWEKLRVPFTVEVDLNETVISSFRQQLRGINTNRWEAWADAARWCLNRNTNLEEALVWANRSIEGGYGGFAANKNLSNMALKSDILYQLDKKEEAKQTLQEGLAFATNGNQMYGVGMALLRNQRKEEAVLVFEKCVSQFADIWYVHLGQARALSQTGDFKQALKALEKAMDLVPNKNYDDYLAAQKEKLNNKEAI